METLRARLGLPSDTVRVLAIERVAVDLMLRGYDVYRALSAASPCELMAVKDGRASAIAVRSAYLRRGQLLHRPRRQDDQADVLALVTPGAVVYRPELRA